MKKKKVIQTVGGAGVQDGLVGSCTHGVRPLGTLAGGGAGTGTSTHDRHATNTEPKILIMITQI